jgi:hypothetical protein
MMGRARQLKANRNRSADRTVALASAVRFDGPMTPERFPHEVDQRMVRAQEWDDLVEQVRQLDGFEDFLRPPSLETVLPVGKDGPVVVINVSRLRCDAIAVTAAGVEVIELPGLTQESVAKNVEAYLRAVDSEATAELEAGLRRCLEWMWESFAREILERLGFTGPPGEGTAWPRIWWCPTGALTLLPIHAAGLHHVEGAAVLDRVISSYTPLLRTLLEARGDGRDYGRAEADARGLLFVGVAKVVGQPFLPNVEREGQTLREVFPDDRHEFLIGPRATRSVVFKQLVRHAWAHFSCHGDQNLDNPSLGGLHLYDGLATVTDFSAQQYQGDFAYLSGCKTAVGGVRLPDEVITLAAALHYTGYRHVIATLWSVRDRQAAQIAKDVYAGLVHNGRLDAGRAAAALHHAVRRQRDRYPRSPSMWTPFAHTGP